MQLRLRWLVIVLFVMGIASVSIVGCGGDDAEETAEKPETSSSPTSPADEGPIVASRPVDFEVEKQAIQEVYSAFYKAFNDNDIKAVAATFDTGSISFGTVFAGNEPVPIADGWNDVRIGILGLWGGIGTKGSKWGQNDQLSHFWIRRNEASAVGFNCFKGAFPGETQLYLVKKKDEWMIQQLDSITQNNTNIFTWTDRGSWRLTKFFTTSEDKAP